MDRYLIALIAFLFLALIEFIKEIVTSAWRKRKANYYLFLAVSDIVISFTIAFIIPQGSNSFTQLTEGYEDKINFSAHSQSVSAVDAQSVPQSTLTEVPYVETQQKPELSYITFQSHKFPEKNGRYSVFSAPSSTSWHSVASNGKVVWASTNEEIYVAGWVGNWLLIRYETKGKYRTGYTLDASGSFPSVYLDSYSGVIISDCQMTDGVAEKFLSEGTTITVLGRMDSGIYIEAYVDGQQARGTVPQSCVGW